MKIVLVILAVLAVAVLGFALWVRIAPVDAARWHQPPAAGPAPAAAPCTVQRATGEGRVDCLRAAAPAAVLESLAAIAAATPRTRLIAGSVEEGMMTWETRSALWSFPDYTTAQVTAEGAGTRLTIHARLRFGQDDMGVNAARLTDWIARLDAGT